MGGCEEALTDACSLLRVSTTFHWQAERQGLVTDKKSVTLLQSFLRVQDSKAKQLFFYSCSWHASPYLHTLLYVSRLGPAVVFL